MSCYRLRCCWVISDPFYRTKIAIRMSRVSDKHKDAMVEESESEESEGSDEDDAMVDPDREETPDLYRNSSLGM